MQLIVFEMAIVARRNEEELLIALMDGAWRDRTPHACVALLTCRTEVARGLWNSIGSALNDAKDTGKQ